MGRCNGKTMGEFKMTKKLEQIVEFISLMTGLNGVLAGGCVRDTLMCQKPKDYDFLVDNWGGVDIEILVQTIEENGGEVNKTLGSQSFLKEPPQDDGNNFLTRFVGGVSFTLSY